MVTQGVTQDCVCFSTADSSSRYPLNDLLHEEQWKVLMKSSRFSSKSQNLVSNRGEKESWDYNIQLFRCEMKLWFMSNLLPPSLQSCTTKGVCRMSSATVTHQMLSFHCSCVFPTQRSILPSLLGTLTYLNTYSVQTTNTLVPLSLRGVDL